MACANLTREEKRKEYQYDTTKAQVTWQNLRDDLFRIGQAWFDYKIETAEIESYLHDTWDKLIFAAKIIPSFSSEHDRLVTLLMEVRELGAFTRKKGNVVEDAKMPNGQKLWIDLPYFAQDLQNFWINEYMSLPSIERESLAVLTAKSYASGLCSIDLAQCALWLLKESLETDRPISTLSSVKGTSTSADLQVSISELLPAVVQCLRHSNSKLAALSASGCGSLELAHHGSATTSPGFLATKAQTIGEGFSMERWLFWRQRLGELYLTGNEAVAKSARDGFEIMALTGLAAGIDIPGEKKYLERLFKALDIELSSRGQGCVGPEDIEINPAWATEDL